MNILRNALALYFGRLSRWHAASRPFLGSLTLKTGSVGEGSLRSEFIRSSRGRAVSKIGTQNSYPVFFLTMMILPVVKLMSCQRSPAHSPCPSPTLPMNSMRSELASLVSDVGTFRTLSTMASNSPQDGMSRLMVVLERLYLIPSTGEKAITRSEMA